MLSIFKALYCNFLIQLMWTKLLCGKGLLRWPPSLGTGSGQSGRDERHNFVRLFFVGMVQACYCGQSGLTAGNGRGSKIRAPLIEYVPRGGCDIRTLMAVFELWGQDASDYVLASALHPSFENVLERCGGAFST